MIYILFFVLSCIYLYTQRLSHLRVTDGGFSYPNNRTSTFAIIFVVIAFSALAGLRDVSIGSDTKNYPIMAYQYAEGEPDYSYYLELLAFYVFMKEVGYGTLVYICAHLFPHFNFMLFISALIINGGYMYFLHYHSKKYNIPIWLPWLFYCCMMFPNTMNLAKQSIAISLGLIAYVKWDQGFNKSALILLSIATTFHFTSITMLVYVFERLIKKKWLRYGFVLILLLTVLGNHFFITQVLTTIPILGRFTVYLENEDGNVAMFDLLYSLLLYSILFLYCKPKRFKNRYASQYKSLMYLMALYILFLLFNGISAQAGRMGMYIMPMMFVYVPLFFQQSKKCRPYKPILAFSLIFYWFFLVIHQGATETYPYMPFWE